MGQRKFFRATLRTLTVEGGAFIKAGAFDVVVTANDVIHLLLRSRSQMSREPRGLTQLLLVGESDEQSPKIFRGCGTPTLPLFPL